MRLKCKIHLCPHKPVRAGTHIRTWSGLWGHQYLVHFQCRTFHFFFPSHTQKTQERKEANKLQFSTQMFFKRIFNFCLLICVLCFCLIAFLCFLCFWCFLVLLVLFGAFWCFFSAQNLSVKKKIEKV